VLYQVSLYFIDASALSGFSLLHYNINFITILAIEYKSIIEMSVRVCFHPIQCQFFWNFLSRRKENMFTCF